MFTIKNYVVTEDLAQAYELNQKKNNVILGGIAWLKMGERNIQTAIDLSKLGLDKIEEDEYSFKIGCMCTLRDMEVNESLNSYFDGAISKSLIHIVGVQFRNCATIGGSIYSRFGFSDILTCLLSLDTYVELYNGGIIPLSIFKDMPYDNDILVRIIIKKDNRKVSYLTHRMSATDIPTLAVAVSRLEDKWEIVLGARPQRAVLVNKGEEILSQNPTKEEIDFLVKHIMQEVKFGSNMRGSKEYRQILAGVFINRGIEEVIGGTHEN
ncbi:putative oxidoreductase [Clostridium saccharobutylicum]|uniref:FAD binding domain-containing protein n=1 Tax=Clostridium saccharobutylicum TaxID=169679 RepID=UPI000983BCA5|nr:FAD binding domain-containing protein [Clostridium saccharobutylicum]AQS09818.1 putative oxidoreductase [Clostridium saccharobutylicum]MBC2438830.1 molybdopterin dehydrogenase [Clostridium saccharobutylicum]NSB91111.1 CO/xanthine dehydrogenase FAD-binding subunit [Clostridium saccharobutylicum]NYC27782.1 CO/xanthine dehydrogenase FAD-binding subunit [Clostridium saccharobutylicum]OOM12426.1 putative oxidoreductase [Clostridium saccharobutylicum]